jgi:hypothetical protein
MKYFRFDNRLINYRYGNIITETIQDVAVEYTAIPLRNREVLISNFASKDDFHERIFPQIYAMTPLPLTYLSFTSTVPFGDIHTINNMIY